LARTNVSNNLARYREEAKGEKWDSGKNMIKANLAKTKDYGNRAKILEMKGVVAEERRTAIIAEGERKETARINAIEIRLADREVYIKINLF
jgi:hypothetical protein